MASRDNSVGNNVVSTALDNLASIKNGDDPRTRADDDSRTQSVEIIESSELLYHHDDLRRDREQIDSDFVEAVNLIEPAHPFTDDPYPITKRDVRFSYCTESSTTWARCGPMYDYNNTTVQFAVDRKTVGKMERERYYNVLVHELTHITEGSHSPGSIHNPRFWRTMADNAVTFIEEWSKPFDVDKFVSYCRHEPNAPMTDRRSMTVEEQQQAVEDRILRGLDR